MEGKRKNTEESKELAKKSREDINIRQLLTKEETKTQIRQSWCNDSHVVNSNLSVLVDPFKCCIIKDFIEDKTIFDNLRVECDSLDLITKNNDLYQFHQSEDLANVTMPAINSLKNFLLGECHSWMQDVTGIELNSKLAVTYSCYRDTDYLLCHDDKCEDRRIAFILYLNNDWKEVEGGALQLFSSNENGQPLEVVHTIFPELNKLVFFEVSSKSFHQVAEVLSSDRSRVTINGWFHSSVHCTRSYCCEQALTKLPPHLPSDKSVLMNYINPCYLEKSYYSEVSSIFEEESQISLVKFLKDDVYSELCNALLNDNIVWEKKGPPNRRQYYVPHAESLPSCVTAFVEFLSSFAVFDFLKKLTNLDLGPPDEGPQSASSHSSSIGDPKYHYEIHKWEKGCYTLLNDDDPAFKESALDAVIFFNVGDLDEDHGGFTSYIARDEDLELLTINPVDNALALSYRDDQTLRFVKYINHNFNDKFYSISFVYNE